MRIGEGNPMTGFSLVIDVRQLEMTESRLFLLPLMYETQICNTLLKLYGLCLFPLATASQDIYTYLPDELQDHVMRSFGECLPCKHTFLAITGLGDILIEA